VVVGYCSSIKPHSAILDVGCGTGILIRQLRTAGFISYLGVDLSEKAIEQAKKHQSEVVRFEVANAEAFQPREEYDVIIFNEILYYFPDPRRVVSRYAEYLRSGGIVIISMHRTPNSRKIWRLLEGCGNVRDAVCVTNTINRLTWDIRVYAKPEGTQ
jgi:2-polyprenyl-3-methyl-5-hydroxy-6-metoxy-1,4-benzoquinol methylase